MAEVSPAPYLHVRPCSQGFQLYHSGTGEFQNVGTNKQKIVEENDEVYLVDTCTGSRQFVDNVMKDGYFADNDSGEKYLEKNGEVVWEKNALAKVDVKAIEIQHKGKNESFLTQEFMIGQDGRHKYWYMTYVEDFS